MKLKYLRWISLGAVFVVVSVGLILNTNLGTLSSFGWQAIATICPLGAVESMLAGRSVFLQALLVLAVVVIVVMVLGKFFCAWVCPIAPINNFREFIRGKLGRTGDKPLGEGVVTGDGGVLGKGVQGVGSDETGATLSDTGANGRTGGVDCAEDKLAVATKKTSGLSPCGSGCSSCTTSCSAKRAKIDSRHIILGGSLLSAALFGFPVFCLLCPIGLLFGTVIVAWQFFGVGDLSLSLMIYPLLLILELMLFRKWCGRLCPMGAMLSLISIGNRFFKPVVDRRKCIRVNGGDCHICSNVCTEGLDPHCSASLNECSKCGLCKDSCPSDAITFAFMPKAGDYVTPVAIEASLEKKA